LQSQKETKLTAKNAKIAKKKLLEIGWSLTMSLALLASLAVQKRTLQSCWV